MRQRNSVPTWVLVLMVVAGLMFLQLVVKPWYMADCMQWRTEAECEFSWKWRR